MDTNERLHHEWLGMAQPEGLVVTASALKTAEANITQNAIVRAALRVYVEWHLAALRVDGVRLLLPSLME